MGQEFALELHTGMYLSQLTSNNDKWYSAGSPLPGASTSNMEHIVVVEFMRRKLAFVFKELHVSQRFLICMELLIRRAQQKQAKVSARSLTPAFQPHAVTGRHCPTPKQVN